MSTSYNETRPKKLKVPTLCESIDKEKTQRSQRTKLQSGF